MPEKLSRDMKELLETFNAGQVQYLVIGAHALGVYAEPRATKDLDIWVNPTPENASRVFKALKIYGAPLHGVTEQFFTDRDTFLAHVWGGRALRAVAPRSDSAIFPGFFSILCSVFRDSVVTIFRDLS